MTRRGFLALFVGVAGGALIFRPSGPPPSLIISDEVWARLRADLAALEERTRLRRAATARFAAAIEEMAEQPIEYRTTITLAREAARDWRVVEST